MKRLRLVCAGLVVALASGGSAMARQSPERGSIAPAITLKDSTGAAFSTASMTGKTLILIFGELDQDRTQQACTDVLNIMALRRFDSESVVPILIVAKAPPALNDESKARRTPRVVLQDLQREAFEAYHVIVLPTVVVVDGKGKVVYTLPAHLATFRELLTDSILCATGKMTEAEFEQAIGPQSSHGESPEQVKCDRLVRLGQELARHGMATDAEAKFREAISIQPGSTGARVALGNLLLDQDKLEGAAAQFRAVLEALPESTDAELGIAAVGVMQGGEELTRAEASLRSMLGKDPRLARARFLMGQIREKQGDCEKALAEYKAAAQIVLER